MSAKLLKKDGISYVVPFLLITICFALWGFANDITNPMVKAFSKIFRMSVTDGALVQLAFYGGYFVMAFPAAMFIRKYNYKSGVLMGLGLYAIGALLFLPAKMSGMYYSFLLAYFIMTCGLSFLETSCNPYILSMGPQETATRRLNLAQSFNPIGSLMGMFVAMNFIQARLSPLSTEERASLDDAQFNALRDSDLTILSTPYIYIGLFLVAMFILIWLTKMPNTGEQSSADNSLRASFRRLMSNKRYREGVIAQFFYVGTQIMCWTFIIQYGTRVFMAEGMSEQAAEVLSQKFNIIAMAIFCVSRFVCTFFLRYIKAGRLLSLLASVACLLVLGVIFIDGRGGIYCLVAVSACMSLMFPTIYGIALEGIGNDAKLGAAGLIMAILGGSILPPLIDMKTVFGMAAENASFVMPLICFVVVAMYGRRALSKK